MIRFRHYFNPLRRVGIQYYSFRFPLAGTLFVAFLLELYAHFIIRNPNAVGVPAILIFLFLTIYFSFRDGIRGGTIAASITIFYYFYIIFSRGYVGSQLTAAVETTLILTIIYLFLALVIGWLKQVIDNLVVQEKNARRLAEEGEIRLQTILEQLPVGVLMADIKTDKVESNRHLDQILGRTLQNQLSSWTDSSRTYSYPDHKLLDKSDWPLVRALQNGEVVSGDELEFVRANKESIYMRVSASPIRNKKQQIIAAVSTIDDVTQEKQLEQKKDNFINMASHELKTPVTSIKVYLELLKTHAVVKSDAGTQKIINSIENQTKRLQELVEDLLDVTRTQTGKLRIHKEVFWLNKLVTETVSDLQNSQYQKIMIKKNQKIQIKGDRFRLSQVLSNLITNAMKYSPQDKSVHVMLEVKGKRAVVTVQDFGQGIPVKHQKKIFERLYQLDPSPTNAFPGIGMGLFISKEIIRQHQGRIWVKSQVGQGSAFSFSVPLISKKTDV